MPRAVFDPTVDYYRLLGVQPTASVQEIRAAYRRLAKSYHPDLNANSRLAAARMARINAAKEVLLHAPVRSAYDASRRLRYGAPQHAGSHRADRFWTAPASPVSVPSAGVRPGGFSARQSAAPRSPHRPVQTRGWLDRWSVGLVLLVAPLVLALAYYVADAVRVAEAPLAAPATTYGLTPRNDPDPTVLANAAYQIVAPYPGPNRAAARSVRNIIALDSARSTPTLDRLRSDSVDLNQAADQDDDSAWNVTVRDLCQLAQQC